MKQLLAALAFVVFTPVLAQSQPTAVPSKQDVALAQYYTCIEKYAVKYAHTGASAGDIADAAVSACSDELKNFGNALVSLFGGGQLDRVEITTEKIRTNGRSFGVRTALEAKYPMK